MKENKISFFENFNETRTNRIEYFLGESGKFE